ncbi:MAG: T9SS type A sorting domain-containing protein, partial [Bacteroidetes bacterium]|nr:T9SS type A sorting domain-containing protein [Bacteroidota bacterium]
SLMLCDYSLDNNLGANWVASDATNASTFAIVNTKQVYATPDSACIVFTDLIPPTVLNAYATGLSKVKVKFSEAVDNTAENVVNYTGIGTISTAVRSASNDTVTLTLTTPLQSGVPATLTISDVKDIAGNPMATSQNFEITYTIPEIVITEIMYDDPSASSDSLEFIELYNNGSAQANISNFSFSSGIVYTFPANTTIAANDYLVIAKNISAVNTFFGISGTLQWTSGSLSNSGEKIEIINIGGDVIDSLTYKTSAPWPTAAAGNGPSLTLCNPSLDNSIGSNWQASEEFVDSLNHIAVSATPGTGCVTTNIENHLAKNYSVNCYPNPASKGLTVSLEGQAKEIFVYDLIGNIVYKTNNVTSITTINTEKLNEGIYFIKIIFNDNTTITKKISII